MAFTSPARTGALAIVTFVALVGAGFVSLRATIPARPLFINVRWKGDVTASRRGQLEARYHLIEPRFSEGNTWRYALTDYSRANVRALVSDPSVDDTSNIDRQTFTPLETPPGGSASLARAAIVAALIGVALIGTARRHIGLRAFWTTLVAALALSTALAGFAGWATFWSAQPTAMLVGFMLLALGVAVQIDARSSPRVSAAIVVIPPAILVAVLCGQVLVGSLRGEPTPRIPAEVTLVSAASHADRMSVRRLVHDGADPNAAGTLDRRRVTPLEAAVLSNDVLTLEELVSLGARLDAPQRDALLDLARSHNAGAVASFLAAVPPAR